MNQSLDSNLETFFKETASPKYELCLMHIAEHEQLSIRQVIDLMQYFNTIPQVKQNFKHAQYHNLSNIGRYYASLEEHIKGLKVTE